jgi:hypothetical protein
MFTLELNMKKMNLLHDILVGLKELERQEQQVSPRYSHDARSEENFENTSIPKKSTIKITRDPNVTMSPSSNKDMDSYVGEWNKSAGKSYEFDPNTIVFYGIDKDSTKHMSKLKDLQTLSIYDPGLADKILTLS